MPLILSDRILMEDGISLIPNKKASEDLFLFGTLADHIKVQRSAESDLYESIFGVSITPHKTEKQNAELKEPTEEDLCGVLEKISLRRDGQTNLKEHNDRVRMEITFFTKHGLLPFLVTCHNLICRFKKDGVVWGVGRGSSCASYILYLLEVHDVNPIKYDIQFIEFSKEAEDQ